MRIKKTDDTVAMIEQFRRTLMADIRDAQEKLDANVLLGQGHICVLSDASMGLGSTHRDSYMLVPLRGSLVGITHRDREHAVCLATYWNQHCEELASKAKDGEAIHRCRVRVVHVRTAAEMIISRAKAIIADLDEALSEGDAD